MERFIYAFVLVSVFTFNKIPSHTQQHSHLLSVLWEMSPAAWTNRNVSRFSHIKKVAQEHLLYPFSQQAARLNEKHSCLLCSGRCRNGWRRAQFTEEQRSELDLIRLGSRLHLLRRICRFSTWFFFFFEWQSRHWNVLWPLFRLQWKDQSHFCVF